MTQRAKIRAIEYYLPSKKLTTDGLAKEFPDWSVDKIESKTGISCRFIAEENELASDLAFHAAKKLFETNKINPEVIDFILLCTQSPDYVLPTTACILQDRLNISTSAGALDFNLGCSGYVYGLSLAKGLIETGQAKHILFLTAETYSKYIASDDRSVRTIFGDAASASLISSVDVDDEYIGPFCFGTDGSGAENLIVRSRPSHQEMNAQPILEMNGPEIFAFTLNNIPRLIHTYLDKYNMTLSSIDKFVFHQASLYMLEHLRDKIAIPKEKFIVYISETGNTVSSTIPIALNHALSNQLIFQGEKVLLVGFGVGYSWAVTSIIL